MSRILENIYIWLFLVNSDVPLLAFAKYTLLQSQLCCFVIFEGKKPLFCDEKLLKIFLHSCISFVQKTAQLILKKLP